MNAKYASLQSEFYSGVYESAESRHYRNVELRNQFGCAVWRTKENNLIPSVFLTKDHLRTLMATYLRLAKKAADEGNAHRYEYFRKLNLTIDEAKRRKYVQKDWLPEGYTVIEYA